jgi:hypothetical protein
MNESRIDRSRDRLDALNMSPFSHEQRVSLSQDHYVRILSTAGPRRLWRAALIAALGLACLFWPYTALLGVLMISLAIGGPLIPRFALADYYRRTSYLHQPITFGASEHEVWAHGESFRIVSRWDNVTVWRESQGWLLLSPRGMTQVFLEIDQLKRAGVYDPVAALARQHAVEFGKRKRSSGR